MTAIKNGTLLVKDSNGNTARVATLSQTDITTFRKIFSLIINILRNNYRVHNIRPNFFTKITQYFTFAQVLTHFNPTPPSNPGISVG